jgi:hypothetical protein
MARGTSTWLSAKTELETETVHCPEHSSAERRGAQSGTVVGIVSCNGAPVGEACSEYTGCDGRQQWGPEVRALSGALKLEFGHPPYSIKIRTDGNG